MPKSEAPVTLCSPVCVDVGGQRFGVVVGIKPFGFDVVYMSRLSGYSVVRVVAEQIHFVEEMTAARFVAVLRRMQKLARARDGTSSKAARQGIEEALKVQLA